MSLPVSQLRQYIAAARRAEQAMGKGRLGMTDSQVEVRKVASQRVVAACDISQGSLLSYDLLTVKRAGEGVTAQTLPRLIGLKVLVDISHDTPLTWDMVR